MVLNFVIFIDFSFLQVIEVFLEIGATISFIYDFRVSLVSGLRRGKMHGSFGWVFKMGG